MARTLESWLQGVWYENKAGAALLAPLATLFRAVAQLRRMSYQKGWRRRHRAKVPVVVVGNLSVGGTGKSPLVALLASRLRSGGLNPGILTRGHGAHVSQPTLVAADSTASLVGDEPVMLATSTGVPVVVSPDRARGAEALEALGVDVILCDDGLQHYALERDLEIAVIDGTRGLGNGRLLPAGPLREDETRLATVDWVVVNGGIESADKSAWQGRQGTLVMQLAPEAARLVADGRVWRSIESFRGEAVHAVAGIGNPARFFAVLRAAGLELIEHPLPDHHAYQPGDFRFGDDRPILMTAKDAVKCRGFADSRLWEIPTVVRLLPDGAAALVEAIQKLCRAAPASEPA